MSVEDMWFSLGLKNVIVLLIKPHIFCGSNLVLVILPKVLESSLYTVF